MALTLSLDITKSVEENADMYFTQAKKARKKLVGLERAMEKMRKTKKEEPKVTIKKAPRKQHWYEKFRWFVSSDGYLCVGGRDATTNEIIIKKHTDANDWVLHTDMAGSPFVIIKVKGKREEVPQSTLDEAAQFTASMSRAWKNGLGTLEVFYVTPEQVTKEAQAGESLARGAFMIRGETKYKRPQLALAASMINYDDSHMLMIGPPSACKKHAKNTVMLAQGNEKTSDVAKKIQKKLPGAEQEHLDVIIRAMPPGGIKIEQ